MHETEAIEINLCIFISDSLKFEKIAEFSGKITKKLKKVLII